MTETNDANVAIIACPICGTSIDLISRETSSRTAPPWKTVCGHESA